MLSWLFKKRGMAPTPPAPAAPASSIPSPTVLQANAAATAKARLVVDAAADWPTQLRAAQGDDAALLKLTQSAAPLAIKLAAVEALVTEQGLKQAEREFRTHDRKVHRIAKQRLEAAVTRREACAMADTLLARTEALLADPQVPINHVVVLDRDWAALPAASLLAAQRERFGQLRTRLDAAIHQHGQAQQVLQRWTADAGRGLAEWRVALAAVAENGTSADAETLRHALVELKLGRPDVPAAADLDAALARALQTNALVAARLAWLEAMPPSDAAAAGSARQPHPSAPETTAEHPPSPSNDAIAATQDAAPPPLNTQIQDPDSQRELPAAPAAGPAADIANPVAAPNPTPTEDVLASTPAATHTDAPSPASAQDWNDLPAVDDGPLGRLLAQRHAMWLAARRPVVAAADAPAHAPTTPRSGRVARPDAPTQTQRLHIENLLLQAEATLAEGRLADLQQQLSILDAALSRTNATALPEGMRNRHQALWSEQKRLRDWQSWGGGRARDDLADEAEALARDTLAAVDASTAGPKLNLKHHAEAVQALRQRWKELDRLGAAAGHDLWHRFDTALQIAFQPLAAQQAALKAARQDNLQAREALLSALELQAVPGEPGPDPSAPAATDASRTSEPVDAARADWRDLARELDRFQLAWRKLGPVEHTVPNRARQALEQRLQQAVDRIERPLQDARRRAASAREALIARAEALGTEPGRSPAGPRHDAALQVRELQSIWQEQARGLPLPRGLENALWARFKMATDAVFAQRQAAFAARDDELQANMSAREALLARLESLGAETPEGDIKRTLEEVDRAWRQAGDVPRGAAEQMEQRLHSAHAAAVQWLGSRARRLWLAQLDTLNARLSMCESRESGAGRADLAAGWNSLGPLPAPWAQALAQRWASDAPSGPLDEAEVDELLLRLETALDMPSAPEWQAARRALKLLALKDSMEGRAAETQGPARLAMWFQSALRQAGLTPPQHKRLQAVITALRQAAPGSLTTTA